MKVLLCCLLLCVLPAFALAEPPFKTGPLQFDFLDAKGTNSVAITIDAPLEPIVGYADGVSGFARFDPDNPKATTGTIEVAVSSLRFPNDGYTQTAHFYALDENKHPKIACTLKKIVSGKVVKCGVYAGKVEVDFTCRGITKAMTVPLTVTYLPDVGRQRGPDFDGDILNVRCDFTIRREDFGIAPEAVPALVAEEIGVRVALVGFHRRLAKTIPKPEVRATAPKDIPIKVDGKTYSLAERMTAHRVPGVSIAVLENFQLKWVGHYGESGGGRSLNDETLYPVGSMAQPLVTAAVLKAAESGQVDLDKDINSLLKSWKFPTVSGAEPRRATTLRDLLTHTSGLRYYKYTGYPAESRIPTLLQVLRGEEPAKTDPVQPLLPPGETFALSMENFTVLQQAAEDVSGRSFSEVMAELLLQPLGMQRSRFLAAPDATLAPSVAVGHDDAGRPLPGGWHVYPEVAASGFWTTPREYAQALAELLRCVAGKDGKYLNPETARKWVAPIPNTGDTKQSIGFGLIEESVNGQPVKTRFFKGGNATGYFCHLDADPTTGNAILLFTNKNLCWQFTNEIRNAIPH